MKMKKTDFSILENADKEITEILSEHDKLTSDEKERMYKISRKKYEVDEICENTEKYASDQGKEEYEVKIENYRRKRSAVFAVPAAVILIFAGVAGITARLIPKSEIVMNVEDNTSASEMSKTDETLGSSFTETSSLKDIAYKIVDAKYNQYDGTFTLEEQQRMKSAVIQNFDQLNDNMILPSNNYTVDFFNENALIFISVVFTNTAKETPIIKKVYYESNEIQINAERGFACDESIEWWCYFLEISKADIADADQSTTVIVNVDGKLPNIE